MRKRARVFTHEKDGEMTVKPITDEYIESMAGVTGTKGKLLKALKEEKAKERCSASASVVTGDSAGPSAPRKGSKAGARGEDQKIGF
jgi:hypothetical protein